MKFGNTSLPGPISKSIFRRWSGMLAFNWTRSVDPTFDNMYMDYCNALTEDEARKLAIKCDDYINAQQWCVVILPRLNYTVYRPWLKGYSGENIMQQAEVYYARWWLDRDAQKSVKR